MRWPWQPKPGMVRIKSRDWIDLQQQAIKAYQLDEENRQLRMTGATLRAEALVCGHLTTLAERGAVAELVASPPLQADGSLHEAAFRAAFDQCVWTVRDAELASLTSAKNGDEHS